MQNRVGKTIGKRILKITLWILLFLSVVVLVVALCMAIYIHKKIEKHIDESLFQMVGSDSATKLYYYEESEDTGEIKAVELEDEALFGGYRCVYADYEQIPEELIQAFVSIEDKRFYQHHGVDWRRTISAGVNYFFQFHDSYGGSTITQQLIKNVTDKNDYSFQRKIQEIFWALDLETKMDKQEILGLYLNIINLSQGCYGVQAASEYYFSKDVSELTLNECACIAAITNSPSYYDPIRNPDHNRERKNLILNEMYRQGYIGYEEMQENVQTDVVLQVNDKYQADGINSWYVDMVIEDVIRDLTEEKGYSRAMANLMIYTGGLKIYTAMDPEIQTVLEEYYSQTAHFYSGSEGAETPQSAMIVIDPENGNILGVVGAVGRKDANRLQNFATQTCRPAGSVIKPLSVYAPAMESGLITWATVYDDVPVNFGNYNLDADNGTVVQPVAWPKNSNGVYRGLTNVNYALAHSINTVTVRVLQDLGLETSFDFLYNRLHMTSLIESGRTADGTYITDKDWASLALGQMNYGVTVREITAAYSIFANAGVYNMSRSYDKVTDYAGSIILEKPYCGEVVLQEETAAVMTMMLENVIQSGTASSMTLQNTVDCAGKTGTTQNNYDRWFIGYTPYFIGGVWYGYEYPKALSGGNVCVNVWEDVMKIIHDKKISEQTKIKTFRQSEDSEKLVEAEYCMDSGLLATGACLRDPRGNRLEKGWFVAGTEPTEYCSCHVPVSYDSLEGGVDLYSACPIGNTEYVGLIHVERSFPMQVYITDAQYVWRAIEDDILPETAPGLPFFSNLLKEGEFCGVSVAEVQYNRLCRTHFDYVAWKEKQRE